MIYRVSVKQFYLLNYSIALRTLLQSLLKTHLTHTLMYQALLIVTFKWNKLKISKSL